MQLIHELSWLWKGIGIIALVSAIVLIAAKRPPSMLWLVLVRS